MKKYLILLLLGFTNLYSQNSENVITSDIDNFWLAFDKIKSTKDTIKQAEYITKLFIEKGTPGLKALMEVRDYNSKSYLDAINNYPLFWNSIRENTKKSKELSFEIKSEIEKIKAIYPELKPAKIYFTIGALLSNGTTLNGNVLIGSELALADTNTNISELPSNLSHLKPFFKSSPIESVVFLNIHEYVHTQQKTTIGNNLLSQCVLEGVAEFVAVTATGKQSVAPAISYGKNNSDSVRDAFSKQMFNAFNGFWLYSNFENQFKTRDLGYYVGYAICEKYYQESKNKKQAIKTMIELNYNNEKELEKFIDKSLYFVKKFKVLKEDYEKNCLKVVKITQFNNSKTVNPSISKMTIEFSGKIDQRFRNFEVGPLGENNVLPIKSFIGYADDGKSAIFEIELKPKKRYQLIVGANFRDENGIGLKPYLIDITTSEN